LNTSGKDISLAKAIVVLPKSNLLWLIAHHYSLFPNIKNLIIHNILKINTLCHSFIEQPTYKSTASAS